MQPIPIDQEEEQGKESSCRRFCDRCLPKSALDAAPTDTLLQRRVTTLDALVTETCN